MWENSNRVNIQLNFKRIHQVLLLLFGLNLFFLFGTWLYDRSLTAPSAYPLKRLIMQLNLGTENVAARVNFMKGEISIHSEKGVGTTTTITIPYSHETMGNEVFSQIDPEVFDKTEG